MKFEDLQMVENSLRCAAKDLRHAWRVMKHNGMEPTAKELADTVLDVEMAHEQMAQYILEVTEKDKS